MWELNGAKLAEYLAGPVIPVENFHPPGVDSISTRSRYARGGAPPHALATCAYSWREFWLGLATAA